MNLGIVGSRSIKNYQRVADIIRSWPKASDSSPHHWGQIKFISGGADGVDSHAERFAETYDIPIEVIEPDYTDWSEGHPAKVRNTSIVEQSDHILAIWDGNSNGTRDTIDKALDRAVPIDVRVME